MEQQIEFFSKGVKLRGVLRMSEGKGPHPLVVVAGDGVTFWSLCCASSRRIATEE